MPDRVRITDVSPRDGLQNEAGIIASADKAQLITLLAETGVDEVEATSFVHPKWVPQLADAETVLRNLDLPPLPSQGRGRGKGLLRPPLPPRPLSPPPRRTYTTPPRDPTATRRALTLRKDKTGPEHALWQHLRAKHLAGWKFRQQHPFGPYVLDYFCPAAALAIELDGQSHAHAREHDEQRTGYLESHGVRVLRFTNDDVVHNRLGVAMTIARVLRDEVVTEAELAPGESGKPVSFSRGLAGSRWVVRGREADPSPGPFPGREGGQRPAISVLIPNMHGMQSALALRAAGVPIDKVCLFTAASETFNQKNTNATIAQSLERFRPVVLAAYREQLAIKLYVSCAFGCPFEGEVRFEQVERVTQLCLELLSECEVATDEQGQLLEGDFPEVEISLADTIGVATPERVRALCERVLDEQGPCGPLWNCVPDSSLNLHLHDTFGRASACVRAGLAAGVCSFDGSVAGLGGCPYASTPGRRAPGNISTEALVRTVHEEGYETGVDLALLEAAAEHARRIVAAARSDADRSTHGGTT